MGETFYSIVTLVVPMSSVGSGITCR